MDRGVGSLGQIAYVSGIYESMTDYGRTYRTFSDSVQPALSLDEEHHRRALLRWLNAWGCRHLALSCHDQVSARLGIWCEQARPLFPLATDRLVRLEDEALRKFEALFDGLSGLHARQVPRNGSFFGVSFGPTAASKSLFALFPQVFVAWDEPIRQTLGCDGSGASYVEFLRRIRGDLELLAERCTRAGFALEMLPDKLGRENSTAPQLVGEYYWVTITRGVRPPDKATLSKWGAWS